MMIRLSLFIQIPLLFLSCINAVVVPGWRPVLALALQALVTGATATIIIQEMLDSAEEREP